MFILRQYFENDKYIVQTQRYFRIHFEISSRGVIIDRNTILRWAKAFNTTGTVVMKRPTEEIGLLERQKTWTG